MSSLLSLTQKPASTEPVFQARFGGDSRHLGKSGAFAEIAKIDLNPKNTGYQAHLIAVIKKIFTILDRIGLGNLLIGHAGLAGRLCEFERYQTGEDRNCQARQQIIQALGGEKVCQTISTVDLDIPLDALRQHLEIPSSNFSKGEWQIQGEDQAGRKFIALRFVSRQTGEFITATIHQRYRETEISPIEGLGDGGTWVMTIHNANGEAISREKNLDKITQFIRDIKTNKQTEYQTVLDRNNDSLEKIEQALGGGGVCQRLPRFNVDTVSFHFYLWDECFLGGEAIVRGTDGRGRLFFALRLAETKSGATRIATIHQEDREKGAWVMNISTSEGYFLKSEANSDKITGFIQAVRTCCHWEYQLEQK